MAVRWLKLMQMLYVCASQNDLRLQNWSAVLSLSTTDLWIGTHLVSKMHQLKQVFALWNCLKEVCFQRFKITGNANSLLNLVETKFYKVGPSLPCLFWFYVPFNLDTPWVHTMSEVCARPQVHHENITVLNHHNMNPYSLRNFCLWPPSPLAISSDLTFCVRMGNMNSAWIHTMSNEQGCNKLHL